MGILGYVLLVLVALALLLLLARLVAGGGRLHGEGPS